MVTDKPITANGNASSPTAELANAVARTLGTADAIRAAGLTTTQAAALAAAHPVPVTSLQPAGPGTTQRATSLIGLLLVFFLLTQYNTWTLIGVLEEKSSRVVEVLLAAVPPARLLVEGRCRDRADGVLAGGRGGGGRAGDRARGALGRAARHHHAEHRGDPGLAGARVRVLLLGLRRGGLDGQPPGLVRSLVFPLALPVIFGYIVSLTAATSGNASLLVHILAYLPPTAPLAMPVLVGLGAVSWWQFAVSVVISVACTVGVSRLAVSVYRRAILQSGRRVRLREALAR